MVAGDVELLESLEVDAGNVAGEVVPVETESEEVGEVVESRRNLEGEVVVGQIEAVETEERRDGGGKLAGEMVAGEKEEFEGSEVGEVGNGAGETVTFETENSEVS